MQEQRPAAMPPRLAAVPSSARLAVSSALAAPLEPCHLMLVETVSRMSGRKRRLAGILAVDVAGYSPELATDEPTSLARVRALRPGIIEPATAT
jgi:hypothetical protein